jgi:hypothetical protein
MKEFLVGLLFLIVVFLFAGVAFLLYPFIIVMGIFLRFIIICAFFVFVIWLLGKMIIWLWEWFNKP